MNMYKFVDLLIAVDGSEKNNIIQNIELLWISSILIFLVSSSVCTLDWWRLDHLIQTTKEMQQIEFDICIYNLFFPGRIP